MWVTILEMLQEISIAFFYVTVIVIGSLLVISQLLLLRFHEITIFRVRVVCLGYVSSGVDIRLVLEAFRPRYT